MSTVRKMEREMLRRAGVKNRNLSREFHAMRGTEVPVKGPAKPTPFRILKNLLEQQKLKMQEVLGGLR